MGEDEGAGRSDAKDAMVPRAKALAAKARDAVASAEPGGRMRLLTPSSTGLRPFPRKIAITLVTALLIALAAARLGRGGLRVLAWLVAFIAACGLGAWAEQRIYHGLVELSPIKRLLATFFVPLALVAVLTPAVALLGLPLALLGDEGTATATGVVAGLWTAFMAVGTAVMVAIDVVVSALVKDFRSRVQLAVLGLLGVVVTMSVAIVALGRLFARRVVEQLQAEVPKGLSVTLGGEVLEGEQLERLVAISETTDFLAFAFVLVGATVTLPSLLSATGKLADGVMMRLHPLKEAIDEVTQGRLDLRVAEGGSRDFLAITKGFNRMIESLAQTLEDLDRRNRELADLNRATSRFVPFQFLDLLGKESIQHTQRGDQIELDISVLFADIRGFTTMAEEMGPEATFGFINRYLGHMEAAIHREDGFIDDVFGDGIMALFHVSADHALRGALGMLEALASFNESLADEGSTTIQIGVGINTGPLMLGTIGGQDRLTCTVIGDPANTAARTEGMTKLYGASLLITEGTYQRLVDPGRYALREVDRVRAKGKEAAVAIYEVLDGEPLERRRQKLAHRDAFATALALFRDGDFGRAQAAFADLAVAAPLDGAARLYVERCDDLLSHGVDDAWDGVTSLRQK